jgi:hypothetical protein
MYTHVHKTFTELCFELAGVIVVVVVASSWCGWIPPSAGKAFVQSDAEATAVKPQYPAAYTDSLTVAFKRLQLSVLLPHAVLILKSKHLSLLLLLDCLSLGLGIHSKASASMFTQSGYIDTGKG